MDSEANPTKGSIQKLAYQKLLLTFANHGISSSYPAIAWIETFMTGWTQEVAVEGVEPYKADVTRVTWKQSAAGLGPETDFVSSLL